MANVKFYDAMGYGATMADPTWSFAPNDNSLIVDGNPYVSQYDYDTIAATYSYNHGEYFATGFISEIRDPYYMMESIYYSDSNHNSLVDLYGVNIKFNSNDDFSNGVIFSNMFAGNDVINGNNYADVLRSGTGNDSLFGNGGNDILDGGAGNDIINGGNGTDTAVFTGTRANYSVIKTASGLTVSSYVYGTDTLSSVERLHFDDKSIAFDINGVAGQAYRIYQAAFDRMPDVGGLSYWIASMDNGMSLREVAKGFIGSAEFQSQYGANPTNYQLTTLLYDNVLHRAPDQGGYDYWTNQLNSGLSRADVLVQFSESPENQAAVIGVIQNGIDYFAY